MIYTKIEAIQSLKPDKSEAELIRELTNLNEEIQETKHGNDLVFYDLG